MRNKLRRALYAIVVALLFVVSAESAARLDDWMHWSLSPLSTPNMSEELLCADGRILRGQPHGKFKKFELNEFGFRGPEMASVPAAGTERVLILGASETFGLYETTGKEYPAQLTTLLATSESPRFEVVNAALPGMNVRTMRNYWSDWPSRFRPAWVFVYPPTHLYLGGDELPSAPGQATMAPKAGFQSRFWGRLRDSMPLAYRQWRFRQVLRAEVAQHPDGWVFESPPADRLQAFTEDLDELVKAIAASGARPILLTHAVSSATPPRSEDMEHLVTMRLSLPRATPEVLVDFEQKANSRILAIAEQRAIPVIDLAAVLNGKHEFFADLVHFNDSGAEVVAQLLADWIRQACLAHP